MYRVITCLTEQHDLWLVGVALLVCLFSWAGALFVLERVVVAGERHRHAWLLLAGATAGIGTWATHFISMLAFNPGMPVGFAVAPTFFSALIGVAGAWAAFEAHRGVKGSPGAIVAGFALAAGMVGLHFVGMAGVTAGVRLIWDWTLVAASLLAVAAFSIVGFVALSRALPRRFAFGGYGLFVAGVVSLHFIAMGALTLAPDAAAMASSATLDRTGLAIMVAFGSAALVVLTAMAAFSDRRIVEERLLRAEEADRSKSRFIANMSHELRTPLNSIIGYAELIVETSAEEMTVADAERVRLSATHLLALVNDLLDLAKIEANRLVVRTMACDLSAIIADAAASLEGAARARRNRLTVAIADDVPQAIGDPLRVKQCLLNLLTNAVKFTEDGVIEVAVRRDGDVVRVSVSDNGIGMTPEQMRRLFKPFVQAEASIAHNYGGTGLGLSITKHLMEMMHGAIDVWSAPGSGAIFTLTFQANPMFAEKAAPETVAA
jgi:signal transduction histidine kinase